MRAVSSRGHFFLADPLSPDSVVVDLGMNRGAFSREIRKQFGCRVVGVEPMPGLFNALTDIEGMNAEHAAVNADGRRVTLYLNGGESSTTVPTLAAPDVATVTVPGTTLECLLARHGVERVALLKVDIEGGEIELLDAIEPATMARIEQMTVEFHDWIDPDQIPDVARVKERLAAHGFAVLRPARNNADVLFVNRAHIRFGGIERLDTVARYKYPQMLGRIAQRLGDRVRP